PRSGGLPGRGSRRGSGHLGAGDGLFRDRASPRVYTPPAGEEAGHGQEQAGAPAAGAAADATAAEDVLERRLRVSDPGSRRLGVGIDGDRQRLDAALAGRVDGDDLDGVLAEGERGIGLDLVGSAVVAADLDAVD